MAAAEEALAFLEEKWGKTYPAIPKLWRSAWEQFTPFLDYDVEIRKVLCARVGRLVSGTRAEEDPLRHVPPKGIAEDVVYDLQVDVRGAAADLDAEACRLDRVRDKPCRSCSQACATG